MGVFGLCPTLGQLCYLTAYRYPRKGSKYPREGTWDCQGSLRNGSSGGNVTVGGPLEGMLRYCWRPRRTHLPREPVLLTERRHSWEMLLMDLLPGAFIFLLSLTLSPTFGACGACLGQMMSSCNAETVKRPLLPFSQSRKPS